MLNLRVFLTYSFGTSAYKSLRYATNYFKASNQLDGKNFKNIDPHVKDLLLEGFSTSLGIIIANKQTSKIFNKFTNYMGAKD